MKFLAQQKRMVVFAVLSSAAVAATASPALAMPIAGGIASAPIGGPPQAVAYKHRTYPGSDSAEAEKSRAGRNAPNKFCEKQQAHCD